MGDLYAYFKIFFSAILAVFVSIPKLIFNILKWLFTKFPMYLLKGIKWLFTKLPVYIFIVLKWFFKIIIFILKLPFVLFSYIFLRGNQRYEFLKKIKWCRSDDGDILC